MKTIASSVSIQAARRKSFALSINAEKLVGAILAMGAFILGYIFWLAAMASDWSAIGSIAGAVALALLAVGYMFGQVKRGQSQGRIDAMTEAQKEIAILQERCQSLDARLGDMKASFDLAIQQRDAALTQVEELKALISMEKVSPALKQFGTDLKADIVAEIGALRIAIEKRAS